MCAARTGHNNKLMPLDNQAILPYNNRQSGATRSLANSIETDTKESKMKKAVLLAIVAAFVLSTVPAFCQEEAVEVTAAVETPVPSYAKVYGVVETMTPQGSDTLMTVTLKEPMEDGSTKVDVILNEWTRVVREYEDLTMADLKAGQPVMVVYEINQEGGNEAVTINLEQ